MNVTKRLIQELKVYRAERHELQSNGLLALYPTDEDDLLKPWTALITTGKDTTETSNRSNIYDGVIWCVELKVNDQYPSKAPTAKFYRNSTPPFVEGIDEDLEGRFIYQIPPPHPNVNFETGEICLDILSKEWTPAWDLKNCCLAIVMLLRSGEELSPLNVDMANLFKCEDWKCCKDLVRYYTEIYGQAI